MRRYIPWIGGPLFLLFIVYSTVVGFAQRTLAMEMMKYLSKGSFGQTQSANQEFGLFFSKTSGPFEYNFPQTGEKIVGNFQQSNFHPSLFSKGELEFYRPKTKSRLKLEVSIDWNWWRKVEFTLHVKNLLEGAQYGEIELDDLAIHGEIPFGIGRVLGHLMGWNILWNKEDVILNGNIGSLKFIQKKVVRKFKGIHFKIFSLPENGKSNIFMSLGVDEYGVSKKEWGPFIGEINFRDIDSTGLSKIEGLVKNMGDKNALMGLLGQGGGAGAINILLSVIRGAKLEIPQVRLQVGEESIAGNLSLSLDEERTSFVKAINAEGRMSSTPNLLGQFVKVVERAMAMYTTKFGNVGGNVVETLERKKIIERRNGQMSVDFLFGDGNLSVNGGQFNMVF